jgi:hypothetical protein
MFGLLKRVMRKGGQMIKTGQWKETKGKERTGGSGLSSKGGEEGGNENKIFVLL